MEDCQCRHQEAAHHQLLLLVPVAKQHPEAHGGRHLPLARPSLPGDRAPRRAGDTESLPGAGSRALASSAQTLCFGILNLAGFFSMDICRVLCVPEVTRRAQSQARYEYEAIPPSSRWSSLLHRRFVPQLPPRSPGLSCALLLRARGRDTRLLLARLWRCLSRQPGSVPSPLPSCSQLLSPAQMEQSCLFSRQAARTSYSHQRRCQLCRLGRYSSSLPGGCRKTSAGSFHVLGLPLPSPIAVPPAKVQGTFLLITCKPTSSSHSVLLQAVCQGHAWLRLQNHGDVVEKGTEGRGHHLDGRHGRAAGDKGDSTQMGLTRCLGKTWGPRFHIAQEQTWDIHRRCHREGPALLQRASPCRAEPVWEARGRAGARGGRESVQRVRDTCQRWIPAPCHAQPVRAFSLPPREGPSPRSAEQAPFPPSPVIVLPSPLLTYL